VPTGSKTHRDNASPASTPTAWANRTVATQRQEPHRRPHRALAASDPRPDPPSLSRTRVCRRGGQRRLTSVWQALRNPRRFEGLQITASVIVVAESERSSR